ncbi:four helix bundle protein [Carboxylicivirga sp. A043]|uniref:four helix bundle protein n=1 Tax=Carboxylicivirga litoralis TaxID=2816963 RepID=UPI0021CB11D0|nr:four helix bundle protein [Carboxylicivirga sp. A043]MCU4158059.1 four helix bundle protein [Carboxylicivirga sp. A043]
MSDFGFKELIVWQKAMDLAEKCLCIADSIKGHYRIVEQLESCSCSVPQNIAEGKGRYSQKEFIHFLHIARGSLYETITVLILLERQNLINQEQLVEVEELGLEIVKMINALITSKRT